MPCYDSRDSQYLIKSDPEDKLYIDKLTRLLCQACKRIDGLEPYDMTKELKEWWERHQKIDRARAKRKDRKYLSKRK